MRINVYSQELTKEVALVEKTGANGDTHMGVRIFFDGSPRLSNGPGDDDRSAITYWLPNCGTFSKGELAAVFRAAADLIERE